ncbi:protein mab-21-like 4 isoform X1 [Microcaecilia unicolor]|uniref:Protein mab-21-like 4 isoform X1 n=1 Tax=Microcaecilia unicolor TaxID=1415580 RepID=A0A6P7ZAL0_9AMPH|nr:protein mab-21-like 4 isoform X1 [Microcaecilia unicolor]
MAVKISPWHHYRHVIKSQSSQRIQHFQRAENVLFTILERVSAMDSRFRVDYCRDHEAIEFSLRTSVDGLTMDVPLWLNAEALLVQESLDNQQGSHVASNSKGLTFYDSYYLEVQKDSAVPECWRKDDVFDAIDDSRSSGHIVPGKVVKLLKDLIVGAIVHCKQHALIAPGDLCAVDLNKDSLQILLLVQCGVKMVHFNIVPVVKRQEGTIKLERKHKGKVGGFLQDKLQTALTLGADLVPATHYQWRYSSHQLLRKLFDIVDTLGGHRLDSLSILDRVNNEYWLEGDRGLSFYHLKIILFWATELFPSSEDWDDLEASVYRLLVILLCCLASKNLPDFLYPDRNLFQGVDLDLSSLYSKVEEFANKPEQFLKIHITHLVAKRSQRVENGIKTLLQLSANDGSYWDTPFFDILLNKFSVYHIQDKDRISAMQNLMLKIKDTTNQH